MDGSVCQSLIAETSYILSHSFTSKHHSNLAPAGFLILEPVLAAQLPPKLHLSSQAERSLAWHVHPTFLD
jgi:hypothetical protein